MTDTTDTTDTTGAAGTSETSETSGATGAASSAQSAAPSAPPADPEVVEPAPPAGGGRGGRGSGGRGPGGRGPGGRGQGGRGQGGRGQGGGGRRGGQGRGSGGAGGAEAPRPVPAERVEHWSEGTIPPLVAPTADNGLRAVFERRYLLKLLVRREISARYQGSFLGLLWSYINPLSQFCIYFFIMGVIFSLHRNIENFAIHIFSAIILVHFFTETFNAGTRSIVRNRSLVQKMAMPREMFPVASMLVSLYHVVPQVVILVIACLFYGWTPDLYGVASFLVAIAIITILGTAMALLFSAANVFFRDVQSAVNILTNLVRFGVPMIYSYEMVGQRFGSFAPYYLLNPMADAVLLVQRAFWVGTTSDPAATAATGMPDLLLLRGVIMVGVSLIVLAIGQLVFSRLENKIPERL